jgi:hypothetical protein
MNKPIGSEALKPNPALEPFRPLIGTWKTVGTHPLVPGITFHGRTSFEWIEGGAFIMTRSEIDEPKIPSGVAILGSDDATGECTMIYFDERGVSRNYKTSIRENEWTWMRNAPGFSQRFTGKISADGRTMESSGELSKDGKTWEPDLALTYTRID